MKYFFTCFFLYVSVFLKGQVLTNDAALEKLTRYNVVYQSPSANSKGSMPLGNGDIGLNVWAEASGDLLLYLSKTDTWSEQVASNEGLLKLGKIRIRFANNPFANGQNFVQKLNLLKGCIEINTPTQNFVIWVDANAPVVHIETEGKKPDHVTVIFESLRSDSMMAQKDSLLQSKLHNDKIIEGNKNQIVWLYENEQKKIPELTNLKFGASIRANGLFNTANEVLTSTVPKNKWLINICALTAQTSHAQLWVDSLSQIAKHAEKKGLQVLKQAHEAWWKSFWLRSWIYVDGTPEAERITQAYTLQRFVNACAGRGAQPIKFNGSIFTMDMDSIVLSKKGGPKKMVTVNGDYRDWGGRYWFQNTRHIYWPMLASGDVDMMRPFFNMYAKQVPKLKEEVKKMYGIDGLIFGEQQPFWGGIPSGRDADPPSYPNHHYTQVLEYSIMGMAYYANTLDTPFLLNTLLPIANDGLNFYANRFKTDSSGKLVFYPCNALETYWKAKNPSGDIAGFRYLVQQLLQLPTGLTTAEMRNRWQRYLAIAPDVPIGEKNGKKIILAAQDTIGSSRNTENTDLCAIFPFQYFGLGKPNIDIAINTFHMRRYKREGCWHWDVINAALLGLVTEAQNELVHIATIKNAIDKKDNGLRFPVFWGHGHDYWPDEDQGGVLMMALQSMLLQADDQQVRILPTWPKDWNVYFKLHTRHKTSVLVSYQQGKLVSCQLSPAGSMKVIPPASAPQIP
jgi:alpha-L-fucosidase 2